jgi:hypothetical protein
MLTTCYILAAFVATASASVVNYPGHLAHKHQIEARQTDAAMQECLVPLMSAYQSVPTPPPSIMSYEATNPVTDACSYSVPATLQAEFSSYESAIKTWYAAHSAEINSALAMCPGIAPEATRVPICTGVATKGAGDAMVTGQAMATSTTAADVLILTVSSIEGGLVPYMNTTEQTGTSLANGTGVMTGLPSTSTSIGGARETGYVAVMAAAGAGLVGAVALL